MESAITELILIFAVVTIGLIIFYFAMAYFIPTMLFSIAEQQAQNIASQLELSVGPLIVNSNNQASLVVEAYIPSYSGNFSVIVFTIPYSEAPVVGVVTPQYGNQGVVYLLNGKNAQVTSLNKVYDINGKLFYTSQTQAYEIPANIPVTINLNLPSSNYVAVIWLLYNSNGYWFRVAYTFTGEA